MGTVKDKSIKVMLSRLETREGLIVLSASASLSTLGQRCADGHGCHHSVSTWNLLKVDVQLEFSLLGSHGGCACTAIGAWHCGGRGLHWIAFPVFLEIKILLIQLIPNHWTTREVCILVFLRPFFLNLFSWPQQGQIQGIDWSLLESSGVRSKDVIIKIEKKRKKTPQCRKTEREKQKKKKI